MSTTTPFIPTWNPKPFPGISLSAGGLLALADLQTIAKRTAITGGASWADAFLLAPGLHYQQAAGDLFRKGGSGGASAITKIVDQSSPDREVTLQLNNAATAEYIQSIAKPGQEVVLDIGRVRETTRGKRYFLRRSNGGRSAVAWSEEEEGVDGGLGWVSHVLYLSTLFLTMGTIQELMMIKGWCLMSILGYMTSRLLNICIIKRRTSQQPRDPSPSRSPKQSKSGSRHRSRSRVSEYARRAATYLVSFGDDNKTAVRLRGKMSDLGAVTSDAWLRSKTNVEGYLEATAKLIVWVVAALSGNMTQVGSLMMMVLLILSAGLLAVSNSRAGGVRVNGRVAKLGKGDVEQGEKRGGLGSTTSVDSVGSGDGRRRGRGDECRPATAAVDSRAGEDGADSAERGEAGHGGQVRVKWKESLERRPDQHV
ncbi:uncharacterized protein PODANS_1_14930 [Podospora anserina S mat+]|uniref:Podospora anserina S mat+ genomic DNA chromosome 1, supercontig 4 n=1 Tax=Podospora anserina (strain S / ATCC MYA-4624 / DSM 980 / FGSC 10383) TaxID=515849 RepID=B2AT77_PODAN|nr:uncharacterized protein PODANS_1_14930 [Podospora anserina S mat+]CAP67600.1 unnamed protein product [Podospora anserina S mat+]CDP23861.1 Putative protein of unknown function [Podospora anserina S mat+]